MSQGADVISGDIYSPQKNSGATGNLNSVYKPDSYYDYAIEMRPGTTNGSVYIYDPVFCATKETLPRGLVTTGLTTAAR